jgi:serine protease
VAATAAAPTRAGAARHLYPTVTAARSQRAFQRAALASDPPPPPVQFHGGANGDGVITGTPRVYLVLWGSQWGAANPPGSLNLSNDSLGVAPRLHALFSGLGTGGEMWSGVMTQYCEDVPSGTETCPVDAPHVGYPTGGALAGVWLDNGAPAPTTATMSAIGTEAVAAAAHFGNTTAASNRSAQYFIASATGTHPDGFNAGANFCAWHDDSSDVGVASPYGDIAFTNFPYVPDMGASCGVGFVNDGAAGALDGVTMVAGHEYVETLTDPHPYTGWSDASGMEAADKCAWRHTGSGPATNLTFTTGTFAMQGTWSNDDGGCQLAHSLWGLDGEDDFAIVPSPLSNFAVPGGSVTTDVVATTTSGSAQTIQLTATDLPPGVNATFASDTISSNERATMTLSVPSALPLGQYDITVNATGSTSHSTTFTFVVAATPAVALGSGLPITLGGATDSDQYFFIDVPSGQRGLAFSVTGGSGNADLSVRRGKVATSITTDCDSATLGNSESCSFPDPRADRWYVTVHGTAAFAGATLRATYAAPTPLVNRVKLKLLSGTAGSEQYWSIAVPPGARRLVIVMNHSIGDADLSVRYGNLPTANAFDCQPAIRSFPRGRSEKCRFDYPASGVWFVKISGFGDFSRLSLKARY